MEYGRPVLWLFWSGLETVSQAIASGAGPWFIACFLALLFASAELLSRHSMEIRILVKVPSVWVYLLLNGASAVTVLALMRETDVFSANNMIQGLGAGVGAVLLLRSSLMHLKVGDGSVDAGLFQLTKIFLNAAERGVIRGGNKRFSDAIKEIMRNVDFAKAQTALPLICLELAEDVSKEQAHQLGVEIAEVRADSSIEEHAKTLWLGIKIGRLTGTDLLSAVVEQLGDQITTTN